MESNLENQLEDYIIKNQDNFYRLAFSYVKNADDAMDVVQQSIYKAFSSIDSLKNFSYMKTWFYRIVVNTSLDLIRKRKREITIGEEFLASKDVSTTDNYVDIDIKRALEDLPRMYRIIIVLRFFEDLKLVEIAEILNENLNTVKTRLYKALHMLRISLSDENKEAKNG